MTATFRIDQPGITGAKPPVGDWGKARADLDLVGVGGDVEFTAQDAAASYLWQVISEVDGSAITLGTPTAQTSTAAITLTGGYIIRLTVDEGLATKDIQELYFGVPLADSGLPIPALNETVQDNRDATPGYERKITAWIKWVDANAGGGGGGGVFEEPAGTTLSTLRTGSGATILADYAFSGGRINTIDATSLYAFVYGGDTSVQQANEISDYSKWAVVFGRDNIVSLGEHTFVQGWGNYVYGWNSLVLGYQNVMGQPGQSRQDCAIIGDGHWIEGDGVVAIGTLHLTYDEGEQSTLLGAGVEAWWPGSLYHAMSPYLVEKGQAILSTHLTIQTSDDSWTDLIISSAGSLKNLTLNLQTIYACELCLIGRTIDSVGVPSKLKTWVVRFTVYNDRDGNVTLYPIDKTVTALSALSDEASWDVNVIVTTTPTDQVIIQVKGAAAEDTEWYGVLKTVSHEDA
jgi:hypothetical protein